MRELKIKPPPGFEVQTEDEVSLPPGFKLEVPKKKVPTEDATDGLSASPTGQDLSDGSQTTPPISGSESFQKTKLNSSEEKQFQDWYKKVSKYKNISSNPDAGDQFYDYRGFFKNEPKLKDVILSEDKDAHFIDKYKLPGHPTFSDESIYSTENTPGGKWSQDKNGKWRFEHSSFTEKYANRTEEYLKGTDEYAVSNLPESFQGTVSEQELSRINDFIKNAPTAKPIDVEKINVVEKITKDRNILDQKVTETGVTLTPEDEYIAQAPKAYEDEMAIILYNALDRGAAQGDIASEMTAVGGDPTDFQAIAQAQRTIEARKGSAVYNAYNNAKTSKEAWDIMTSTPGGFATILTEWGLQSLSAMLRHGISRIAVGSAAGAAMGSVIPGAGTLAGAGYGAATGMGATSLNLEYSGKMLEVFSEMGVNTTDPKQLENIFTDEQKLAEARSKALKRGVPIAIFDAVSGGVAGKLVSKPAKTIAGKGLKWLSETGIQMSFDAAGEVSGQALSGEDISMKEVIPEVLGGLPIDVAAIGIGSAGRSLQQKMRMETFRNVGSIPQGVDKVAVMKEQIEFNLASGQITPEVADQIAQNVVIATEVDKTIPDQIQGEQRAASLPILVEKKELEGEVVLLEQEKEVTDPAFHSVIDDEIKAIQEAVKEKDNAIKNIITAQPEAVTTEGTTQTQEDAIPIQESAGLSERQQAGDSQEIQQGNQQIPVQEVAKKGEEKVIESTLTTNQDEKQNDTRGDISSTSDRAQQGSDSRNEEVARELQGRIREASELAQGGQRKSESAKEVEQTEGLIEKEIDPKDRPTLRVGDMEGMDDGAKRFQTMPLPTGETIVFKKNEDNEIFAVDLATKEVVGFATKLSDIETDLSVAVEFQQKGIGTALLTEFYKVNPDFPTGGLTPLGKKTVESVKRNTETVAAETTETITTRQDEKTTSDQAGRIEKAGKESKGTKAKGLGKGRTPKSRRKIKDPRYKKALDFDPTTPYAQTLQYFIKGGKISSNLIKQLLGGGGKKITGEINARIGLINNSTGAASIDALAHNLYENQTAEGRFESSDFREAVEEVLLSFNGTAAMVDSMIEQNETDKQAEFEYYQGQLTDEDRQMMDEIIMVDDYYESLSEDQKQELIANYDNEEYYDEKAEVIKTNELISDKKQAALDKISQGLDGIVSKIGAKKNLTQQERTTLLQDLKNLIDGAIELGGISLKEAVDFALEKLKGVAGITQEDIDYFEKGLTPEKDDREKRRFTQQVLKELPEDVKSAIKDDTIYYDELPNKITLETAGTILTSLGDAAAITAVQDLSNGMSWPVRNTLGQLLIKKLNQQGDYDAMIVMLDTLTKNATELGQGIQALSMFQYLTAEGQLRIAQKQIDQQRKKRASKRSEKKRIDKAKTSLKDAVNEAASEAVKTVTGESITPPPSKRKPAEYGTKNKVVTKDRYSAALSRAKKSFFSTPFNEDVLIVATYHLEASGRKFAEFSQSMIGELGKKVRPYLKDLFYKAKERLNEYNDFSTDSEVNAELVNLKIENIESEVKQGLKSINARIADIAKAHFTVYDAAKTSLKEKLMEGVELSEEEASKLASAIEKEFNRLITDKKSKLRQVFLKEKVATKKTVAGIEKKLLELVNIGAFSDSEFMDKWAEANDYPKLTKENIDKIKELASKVETAKEGFQKFRAIEDLLAYQAKIKGISFTDIAMSIWYANILSGYTTQMVNIVSTFLNSMALLGVNATRSPLNTFNFAMSYFNGFKTGILEGREVLISGYSPIRGKIDVPATLELVRFKGGKVNPLNYLKYVRRFMVASDVVFFESLKEMKAYQLAASMAAKEGKLNPSLDEKNRASEILNQTDTDYQNNLIVVQNEYDETVDQINKSSLSKSDKSRMLSQAIRDKHRRMYELSSINRDEDLQQESFQYALKGTFNQKPEGTLGALVAGINAALNKVPLARLVVPFTNIIANVANATIDYTPFGFMRAARGGILTKQELTDSDRVELITKASFGLVAMTTVFLLSGSDEDEEPILEITANGTGDYRKNYNLKDWQAYSFRFKNPLTGEKTGWIKYSFSPLNIGFAYIGNLRDAEKYRNKKITDTDWTAFQIALTATSRVLFDMTFLTSINTFLSAIANPQDENTIDNFIKGFQNTAKGFVLPNLYQQGFKQVQEFQQIPFKETNTTMMGWLLKDIPVARNMYQDKINALGEPVIPDMDKFYSSEILPPVIEINDVWKLIAEKGMTNLAVPSIRKIRVGDPATGKETFLTDEEYFEFCKFRGGLIKTTLQNLISHNATSHLDRDWMTTNQKAATKAAKNYIYQLRVDSQKR